MLKALFVGLGSIGQRHLQNLQELMPAEVIAYRTSRLDSVIRNGRAIPCEGLANYYNLTEYRDLNEALAQKPDISFVCNPSSLHLETAIKLAEKGSHLFIEKPLATDIRELGVLENLVEKNKLITMVGFQTRFHPVLKAVRAMLSDGRYGEVVSVEFLWHSFLPAFHAYEDYWKSYAARSDLGGGVVFGLSHELDLIQWLLGVPNEVYALRGATSRLRGDAEDTVMALFNCNAHPVALSLSYAQGLERRRFSILMQDAVLECDLQHGTLRVVRHDKSDVFISDYEDIHRNDLFRLEMEHFLTAVIEGKETDIPISKGKKSLIMSLAVHESLKTGRVVEIHV